MILKKTVKALDIAVFITSRAVVCGMWSSILKRCTASMRFTRKGGIP
jgi:hypothetical protein